MLEIELPAVSFFRYRTITSARDMFSFLSARCLRMMRRAVTTGFRLVLPRTRVASGPSEAVHTREGCSMSGHVGAAAVQLSRTWVSRKATRREIPSASQCFAPALCSTSNLYSESLRIHIGCKAKLCIGPNFPKCPTDLPRHLENYSHH